MKLLILATSAVVSATPMIHIAKVKVVPPVHYAPMAVQYQDFSQTWPRDMRRPKYPDECMSDWLAIRVAEVKQEVTDPVHDLRWLWVLTSVVIMIGAVGTARLLTMK